jgi:hypothetical protein
MVQNEALIHSWPDVLLLNNKFAAWVYKKLIINFNLLFYIDIYLWVKNKQINPCTGKIGLWRALPQIIHRVIHRFCG